MRRSRWRGGPALSRSRGRRWRIDGSRRIRIAQGSGTSTQDVNALLKQFKQVAQMMKQFSKVNKKGKRKLTGMPPGLDPGALGGGGGLPFPTK